MKLFVSDLDGTLYCDDQGKDSHCGEENRRAIRQWCAQGNLFAIATARVHKAYEAVIEDLGFPVDFLGGNGAELIFTDHQRILRTVKSELFLDLAEWLESEQFDATIKINIQGQWFSSDRRHYPYDTPERIRNSLASSQTIEEAALSGSEDGVNLGIIVRPDQRDTVKERLRRKLKGIAEVVSSDADNLDLMPPHCSKAEAVLLLLKRHGLTRDDLIVIGDSENDLPMLALTSRSYCMAQAEAAVKAQARFIVSSVAEALNWEMTELE